MFLSHPLEADAKPSFADDLSRQSEEACAALPLLPASAGWSARLQQWRAWWCEPVHLPKSEVFAFDRGSGRRPQVALLALAGVLSAQCLMPGLLMMQTVRAAEMERRDARAKRDVAKDSEQLATTQNAAPLWYRQARERERAQQARTIKVSEPGGKAAMPVRLAQGQTSPRAGQKPLQSFASAPGAGRDSAPTGCTDCQVTVRKLDLSRAPTEQELRRAGQFGGALTPLRPAEPNRIAARLSAVLKAKGVAGNLIDTSPPTLAADMAAAKTPNALPARRLLALARLKFKRAQNINLSFGTAMQEWNSHNYPQAAQLMREHLKKYPDSPWAGEAQLHLGCDAKYNGRFAEAQEIYNRILDSSSEDQASSTKGFRAKQQKRLMALKVSAGGTAGVAAASDAAPDAASGAARLSAPEDVTRLETALRVATTPEQMVAAADEQADESFDIHQKAKLRWADLDLGTGQFADAQAKLRDILRDDSDWRRRTWAASWLRMAGTYSRRARSLRACGTRALSALMASLDKTQAANQLARMRPTRADGFNLAELQTLANRFGVPMRGFKVAGQARASQLATLPTPFIIHYDFGADHPAIQGLKAPQAAARTISEVGKQAKRNRNSPYHVVNRPGHFLLVRRVDAARKTVSLFDPQANRNYTLSFQDLDREWSGTGLVVASAASLKPGETRSERVSLLSPPQMKKVVGGCCGVPRKTEHLGKSCNNSPVRGSCNDKAHGEPNVSVNPVTLNMFITDTPLWYQPPIGPSVEISISYNAQDATNQNTAFGNKWSFNYGSYLVEDTGVGGGVVTVFMPDGREDNYFPQVGGGFTAEAGNYSTLVKKGTNTYELQFQDGSKFIYGIPPGTQSQQSSLLEERDSWGNGIKFTYADLQLSPTFTDTKLVSIADAQNKVTRLQYDAQGHVVRVINPFERVASFRYDANGNMVECVDIEGHAFQYAYDANVNVTWLNTAQGPWQFKTEGADTYPNTINYYPPPNANMAEDVRLTITDPLGQNEEYMYFSGWVNGAYDSTVWLPQFPEQRIGDIVWHVDKKFYKPYQSRSINNGARDVPKTVWLVDDVIDGKGMISRVYAPNGDETRTRYDSLTSLPTSVTDERNLTTSFTYNAKGQVLTTTDPKGRTTTMTYAANGLDVARVLDAESRAVMSATYNAQHQPLTVTQDPDNLQGLAATTTISYKSWGAPDKVTEPLGTNPVTSTEYDANARPFRIWRGTAAAPQTSKLGEFTYDLVGRVRTALDAAGVSVTYEYNNLDNVTKATYSDGTTETTDYVCCGMPGVTKDRSGRKSYYDYDPLKRLIRVQDANGQTLQYDYDANDNMAQLVDAKGGTTRWVYDALDRVTQKLYHDGTSESYTYTQGLLSAQRDAQGRLSRFSYDNADNLTGVDYATMADVSLSYDVHDRVATMTTAGLGTHTYTYDLLGRLKTDADSFTTATLSYGYDVLGRRTSFGTTGGPSVTYGYDGLSRLASLQNGTQTWSYGYIGNTGMLQTLTRPNGSTTSYGYDNLERLTSVLSKKSDNTTLLSRYAYGYDLPNNKDARSWMERQTPTQTTQRIGYTYDSVDQLKSERSGETTPLLNTSYSYDPMGNRSQVSTSGTNQTTGNTVYGQANKLNQIGTATWTPSGGTASTTGLSYDMAGNMKGQTSGSGGTSYTYDEADRLIRVSNTSSGANTSKSEFVYDGMSRLVVSKEFNWSGSAWVQGSEKRRVYDGMDVVQERDGASVVQASLVRDGNIGGILSRTTSTGTFYYNYDGSGNVTQLTDASQNIVAEYGYDAYGQVTSQSGSQAGQPYGYSTKEKLGGLLFYGFRFYNAGLGRWINRDPLEEDGGTNLYAMVGNNPMNVADPYGLWAPAAAAPAVAGVSAGTLALAGGIFIGGAIGVYKGYYYGVDLAKQAILDEEEPELSAAPVPPRRTLKQRGKPEMFERFGSKEECEASTRTNRLLPRPAPHQNQPKWIAELGVQDPRRLSQDRSKHSHRLLFTMQPGTRAWMVASGFMRKPNEPGRYEVPAIQLAAFNARIIKVLCGPAKSK